MIGQAWQPSAPAALDALGSRGPDAQALWRHEDALLGHTRLSVIDLETGAQPMLADERRYAIVYNGEIYNFAALRRELEGCGRRFATRSDTEVLLQGLSLIHI